MNVKIGAIIKKLRTENNVTHDALASAVGVTPQAISRWDSEIASCYTVQPLIVFCLENN